MNTRLNMLHPVGLFFVFFAGALVGAATILASPFTKAVCVGGAVVSSLFAIGFAIDIATEKIIEALKK